jgi:hypothetical protein
MYGLDKHKSTSVDYSLGGIAKWKMMDCFVVELRRLVLRLLGIKLDILVISLIS